MAKVKFLKAGTHIGYGYAVGQVAELNDSAAKELVDSEYCVYYVETAEEVAEAPQTMTTENTFKGKKAVKIK